MIWRVIYEDRGGNVQPRAARSRDQAIHMACELMQQSCEVRRAIGPDGSAIERVELEEHYDEGRFPGLRRATRPPHRYRLCDTALVPVIRPFDGKALRR